MDNRIVWKNGGGGRLLFGVDPGRNDTTSCWTRRTRNDGFTTIKMNVPTGLTNEDEPKENERMNYSTAALLMYPDKVRAIKVTYEKDTETKKAVSYVYKSFDKDIKVGDYVVVPTSTRHGMTVCKVSEVDIQVDLEDTRLEVKWIVSRVDNHTYEEVLSWETKVLATVREAQAKKKREELRKNLEESLNGALSEIKALPMPTIE